MQLGSWHPLCSATVHPCSVCWGESCVTAVYLVEECCFQSRVTQFLKDNSSQLNVTDLHVVSVGVLVLCSLANPPNQICVCQARTWDHVKCAYQEQGHRERFTETLQAHLTARNGDRGQTHPAREKNTGLVWAHVIRLRFSNPNACKQEQQFVCASRSSDHWRLALKPHNSWDLQHSACRLCHSTRDCHDARACALVTNHYSFGHMVYVLQLKKHHDPNLHQRLLP